MFGRRCVALGCSIARFLGAERARFLHAPDGPERVRISPRVSHTELTQWVMPSDTGVEGLTQGGVVMSWIGRPPGCCECRVLLILTDTRAQTSAPRSPRAVCAGCRR